MNKAISKLPLNEDPSIKQMAIVIPLHPAAETGAKRYRKKTLTEKKGIDTGTPAPNFTSAVFRPKKHDLL